MKLQAWMAATLLVFGISAPAAADLAAADKKMLQDAVERCGKLHGTTYEGKTMLERGPFLYDLITLADSLGASDPERQLLRVDFSRAAERKPQVADALPADEIARLRAAAKDCQQRYAKK